MTISYTLGVVSHVDREAERKHLEVEIWPDMISIDDGHLGVGGNHRRVLRALCRTSARTGAGWVTVLEDDALPVAGFHQQLRAALAVAPTGIVSLYNGAGYPQQRQREFEAVARRQDVHWIKHTHLRHAVGYAIRLEHLQMGLLDYLDSPRLERWAPDDAISAWAIRHAEHVSYTNPSLVDHRDGKPVIAQRTHLGMPTFGRKRQRVAHHTGTRLSWSDSSVTI